MYLELAICPCKVTMITQEISSHDTNGIVGRTRRVITVIMVPSNIRGLWKVFGIRRRGEVAGDVVETGGYGATTGGQVENISASARERWRQEYVRCGGGEGGELGLVSGSDG